MKFLDGRIRTATTTALLFLVFAGSAAAQLGKEQQDCLVAVNKGGTLVAKEQGKADVTCVKDSGLGKLAGTADACLSADTKGKLQKAKDRTVADAAKKCAAPPAFGYPGAAATSAAAERAMLDLVADVFGASLDPVLASCSASKPGCQCQQKVLADVHKVADTRLAEFLACKKTVLKAGASDATALESCVVDPATAGSIAADTKARIAKSVAKLDADVARSCEAPGVTFGSFPGACDGSSGSALVQCLDRVVGCRVCQAIDGMDALSVDCDLFDDGAANGSCNPSPTPTPVPSPTPTPGPTPGRLLADGGNLYGPAGFAMGAVPGTLPTPLWVVVETTALPTPPIPGDATPHGEPFLLSGNRKVTSAAGTGFVVALPIPDGVATDHLGVAVFDPADPTDAGSLDTWSILPGLVDPVQRQLLVLVRYASPVGAVLVVVEHPGLDSPVNPGSSAPVSPAAPTGSSGGATSPADRGPTATTPTPTPSPTPSPIPCAAGTFKITCLETDPDDQQLCEDNQFGVRDALDAIRSETLALGFPEPSLYFVPSILLLNPPSAITITSCGYDVTISSQLQYCTTRDGGSVLAYYNQARQTINMCILPYTTPPSTTFTRTLRHEYFHALQYAYPEVHADWLAGTEERWAIESSATILSASVVSGNGPAVVRDPGYPLRKVNRSAMSVADTDEYELQDFWADLFRPSGTLVQPFQDLFTRGSSIDDVIDWRGGAVPLGEDYLSWVRNQTMAEEGTDENGDPVPTCTFRPGSVDQVKDLTDTVTSIPIEPLTTVVYRWKWNFDYVLPVLRFWEFYSRFQNDEKIRFKAYRGVELNCGSVNDGFRRFENVLPGEEFYLVVSNIDPKQERQYLIQFD